MTKKQAHKKDSIVCEFCIHFQEEVKLLHSTWHNHILVYHPYMKGKLPLITETLTTKQPDIQPLRKRQSASEFAIFRKCPDFKPYGNYLCIGVKRVQGDLLIVTTAFRDSKKPDMNVWEDL